MPTNTIYRVTYKFQNRTARIDFLDWKSAHVRANKLRQRGAKDARVLTIPVAR